MPKSQNIAIMTAHALPQMQGDDVPEWVHLLPRGGEINTYDNRGPYRYDDAAAVIAASMAHKGRLIIDENHSTDRAGQAGLEAPARGYITEMEERGDGIWARVDWTNSGHALLADRAYWGISPVFRHDKAGNIQIVMRAALTNDPNLRGLTALNTENDDMPFQEVVAKLLGLDPDAATGDITEAITTLQSTQNETAALQSQIDEIGSALGVAAGGDVLAAAQSAQGAGDEAETIVALQGELNTLASEVKALREGNTRQAAETFIDGAIREKRVGVANQRDRFIAMHMKDPAGTEELVAGFQKLDQTGTTIQPPAPVEGDVALNSEQSAVAKLMGIDPDAMAKTLEDERKKEAR